jgi:hypothetical protein
MTNGRSRQAFFQSPEGLSAIMHELRVSSSIALKRFGLFRSHVPTPNPAPSPTPAPPIPPEPSNPEVPPVPGIDHPPPVPNDPQAQSAGATAISAYVAVLFARLHCDGARLVDIRVDTGLI